jgi:hypothetical protein
LITANVQGRNFLAHSVAKATAASFSPKLNCWLPLRHVTSQLLPTGKTRTISRGFTAALPIETRRAMRQRAMLPIAHGAAPDMSNTAVPGALVVSHQ